MSLVFASSVQTAPEPSKIPEAQVPLPGYVEQTPEPTAAPTPVPTLNITPNPAYKTLQVGDKGENVRIMQEKLQEYGYYEGEIDGAFGNQSRQAVEQFQYMHGLTVDGIAGRHTLTVLFESDEIRPPQGKLIAEPTPQTQLALAITPSPEPTPENPPVPVEKAAPILITTPVPTAQPKPTAEPVPVQSAGTYAVAIDDGKIAEYELYRLQETLYLPVLEVLEQAGIHVISSSTVQIDEYAFASALDLVRFTHTENQEGEPVDLQVYRNDEPQLVPDRKLYRADQILYMPLESFLKMTGMTCTVNEDEKTLMLMSEAG